MLDSSHQSLTIATHRKEGVGTSRRGREGRVEVEASWKGGGIS